MSPQHAWVLSHVLKKSVDIYLDQVGTFQLPEGFLTEKDLLEAYNSEIRDRKPKQNVPARD
jgi:hypothetical protein